MITLSPEQVYAERLAIEAGEPVALSTMEVGMTLRDYEADLRRMFERYPDSMKALARKVMLYPPTMYLWQLPWELRLIQMDQECRNDIYYAVEDLDPDSVSVELEEQGYVFAVMAAALNSLADDLTRKVPWYKRWFITRKNLARELEERITFLT